MSICQTVRGSAPIRHSPRSFAEGYVARPAHTELTIASKLRVHARGHVRKPLTWETLMRTRIMAAALACAALLCLRDSEAFGFCRTVAEVPALECRGNKAIYWKSQCVGYHVNQQPSRYVSFEDVSAAAEEAFAAWAGVTSPCVPSIDVVQLAPTLSTEIGYFKDRTNENIIVLRDDGVNAHGGTLDMGVGLVTVSFNANTGEILDADIEIDASRVSYAPDGQVEEGKYDLRRVMAHAAGHFLGLAHSQGDSPSLMAPSMTPGPHDIHPSADDAAGICSAYRRFGIRASTDDSGQEVIIASTACSFDSVESDDTSSGPSSGQNRPDSGAAGAGCPATTIAHGCSLGRTQSGAHDGARAVLLGLALGTCRMRRGRKRSAQSGTAGLGP